MSDPITLGPVPNGMDNRHPEHALPAGTARNLVNVDVDAGGHCRRRPGMTRVIAGAGFRCGFSCELGAFYVEGNTLFHWDGVLNTALISSLVGRVAYCYTNGTLLLSDDIRTWRYEDGVLSTWGIEPPAAPVLAATTGALPPGQYIAALVWVDAAGRESGASEYVSVRLLESGGIQFGQLPYSDLYQLRLYLSTANGSLLYHVVDTDAESFSVRLLTYDGGNILDLSRVSVPPRGRIIREYKGRIYIADDTGLVWYSDPFTPDRFRLDQSYERFPGQVMVMEPVDGGIFFATAKRTWFYAGNPEDGFDITLKFTYGAVFGTGVRLPDGRVRWQSQRGLIAAGPGGQCENVQEKYVATEEAATGALLIKEQDGRQQAIVSLHQPGSNKLAASSWIEAEIIRRGG